MCDSRCHLLVENIDSYSLQNLNKFTEAIFKQMLILHGTSPLFSGGGENAG
jgi:hypothetical protein